MILVDQKITDIKERKDCRPKKKRKEKITVQAGSLSYSLSI